ncbi:hypothetical protein [Pontixanthobacter sp. CEM42]|uniref:hypothetical protein n=1 Tax=Pontixanthobacter sp. CEM42 TaxID=2792077 RepID=UPI001ADF13EF|nr:hypothetical protein [Pontixanthobacter sp. CEM42]
MIEGANIALSLTAISLAFFFYLGQRNRILSEGSDDFWFGGREISQKAHFFTWLASAVAFSSAIVYYMQVTSIWGYWVYFGSILTYIIGLLAAVFIVSRYDFKLSEFETTGRMVETRSGNRYAGIIVDGMNALSLLALVYIEIGLGVKIFSFLFSESNLLFELFCFSALISIPYFYIKLGGFRAIVSSDIWQGVLIVLGLAFLLVFFLSGGITGSTVSAKDFWPQPSVGFDKILPYLMFALVVNFFTSIPQVSVWQRFAASANTANKYRTALLAIIVVGLVFALYIGLAGAYINAGKPVGSIADIFTPIVDSGPVATQVIFPLVFVGFIAALVSSADSASLAATMTIFGRRRLGASADAGAWQQQRSRATTFLAVAFLAMLLFHTYVETVGTGFASVFLGIIFYLFSQIAVAAPIVVLAVVSPSRLRSDRAVCSGLLIAWSIMTAGFLIPNKIAWLFPQISSIFEDPYTGGMVITLVSLLIVLAFSCKISGKQI